MKKLLLLSLLFTSIQIFGQDQTIKELESTARKSLEDDTSHKAGWKKGLVFNLGLAQGNSSNWAAGAEKSSFAVNAYANLFANLKRGKHQWNNSLDLFYALQTTTSQGTRKTDDRIDFYTKYTYKFKPKWGFGVVGNLRTQFSDGYDYNKTPYEWSSSFFSPAYMTIGPGIDWTPTDYFSVFLSPLSARFTYVGIDSLAKLYSVDPGKHWRVEAGAFMSVQFNKEILKNVFYKSRLDLYSNYFGTPKNVDVFWTNIIGLKVNKWLTVTYNLDMIYDDDVRLFGDNSTSPALQLKSLLSVGFSVRL